MKSSGESSSWFMPLPGVDLFLKGGGKEYVGKCELFSSGRDAIFRAAKIAGFPRGGRMWIPEYFCPDIAELLGRHFEISLYMDFPSEGYPRFETLRAAAGDAVIAVDFFGLRTGGPWERWISENSGVLVLSDHSHAPFSDWASGNVSDFSFASLRKTLPVPDGAFLKTERAVPAKMFMAGSEISGFAADMLSGAAACEFAGYEAAKSFYYSAEAKLGAKKIPSRISKYSLGVLANLDINLILRRRFANLVAFCRALKPSPNYRELNAEFENLSDPRRAFSPVLKFPDMRTRDRYYNALVSAGASPSIYWGGFGRAVSADTRSECGTMLVIPLDFRHSPSEASRLAELTASI